METMCEVLGWIGHRVRSHAETTWCDRAAMPRWHPTWAATWSVFEISMRDYGLRWIPVLGGGVELVMEEREEVVVRG